jgi:gamma-glutamylcyclotransferase
LTQSNQPKVNVFAYGSNMSVFRIRSRVASARVLWTGYVCQRRFAYHKRSIDGSAKANSIFTGHDADRTWGVVYQISLEEKGSLDRYETLGVGYDHEQVDVIVGDAVQTAWIYVARREAIDESLKPYSWYHRFVVHGAREHRLPQSYIDQLKRFESIRDPDTDRHDRNRRLLSVSPGNEGTSQCEMR